MKKWLRLDPLMDRDELISAFGRAMDLCDMLKRPFGLVFKGYDDDPREIH